MVKMIVFIVGIFLFAFVFSLIMYKFKNQQSSLDNIEDFCENKVTAKFDTDEISIDEAVDKEFKLLDF